MNGSESTDTNTLLRHLLSLPHDPAAPIPQHVQDAAARLSGRAHARLSAGLTAADVRRAWTEPTTTTPTAIGPGSGLRDQNGPSGTTEPDRVGR